MAESTPENIADTAVGTPVPYDPVYKNTALLQLASGSAEATDRGLATVDQTRADALRQMQKIAPHFFRGAPWPDLLAERGIAIPEDSGLNPDYPGRILGLANAAFGRPRAANILRRFRLSPPSPLSFRQELEFRVLGVLHRYVSANQITIDDSLPDQVRGATIGLMRADKSTDTSVYTNAWANILERIIATRVLGVMIQRRDTMMYPILPDDSGAELGPLMIDAIREVSRRIDCEDLLFEDDSPPSHE